MRHEENYCIWSGSSIGGCPLEEASEQERIPSIIGSIVWCFPTSRVWYNKVVVFSILFSESRSPGSEVMNILNSTVFQSFSRKSRDFLS
jgi:hypothetical protein